MFGVVVAGLSAVYAAEEKSGTGEIRANEKIYYGTEPRGPDDPITLGRKLRSFVNLYIELWHSRGSEMAADAHREEQDREQQAEQNGAEDVPGGEGQEHPGDRKHEKQEAQGSEGSPEGAAGRDEMGFWERMWARWRGT